MRGKILVVEDDAAILDGFRIVLTRAGYTVSLLSDAAQLLDGDFAYPDLIILDKQLSGIDGLDVCRHLKTRKESRHIPVIITSASPHVAQLSSAALADGFIEKPFNNRQMLEIIKKHLR